jgi:biopolymer transport protein ExbD
MARRQRRVHGHEEFPEPNLLPLMNILLMLILALTTMASLLPLGFLSSEAQKLARGGMIAPEKVEEKKPLNLIVFITETGFNISTYGQVKMGDIDPSSPNRKRALIPNKVLANGDVQFDYPALQAKLAEVKKLSKDEESMTITADPKIIFNVLVQTMDWSRFDSDKNLLFPKVSFAAGIVG